MTTTYSDINQRTAYAKPAKVAKVMSEYKHGTLHSGSAKGPVVQSRDQAVAIAMSEAGKSRGLLNGRKR